MAIKKKIITAMKTQVISDPDKIPGSAEEIGRVYRLDSQPSDMPDEVWEGAGEYLFNMESGEWTLMKIAE